MKEKKKLGIKRHQLLRLAPIDPEFPQKSERRERELELNPIPSLVSYFSITSSTICDTLTPLPMDFCITPDLFRLPIWIPPT